MATTSKQAIIDLNKKLKLEKVLLPDINKQFRKELKLFRSTFIETGNIPQLSPEEWNEMLQQQFDRSFAVFVNLLGMSNLERLMALNSFEGFSNMRAPSDSRIIIDTSQREMVQSLNMAETALREEGLDVTRFSIATTATRILSRKFNVRSGNIATTETQAGSEQSKSSEATAKGLVKKVWNTILDGNEREAHLNADGQEQLNSEPFVVGGELLKQPGDTSLGATIGNVARCRCSAAFGN